MTLFSQKTFSGGEISPSLYGRVDVGKYQTGLRTCRNMLIQKHGGAANRPGTSWVASTRKCDGTFRLIEFIFNENQTYILVLGDGKMSVIKGNDYVLDNESAPNIHYATATNPLKVSWGFHQYQTGELVKVIFDNASDVTPGSLVELIHNKFFVVGVTQTSDFELLDLKGNIIDASSYSDTPSFRIQRIYEIDIPYADSELNDIDFVQSGDVVTLTHPNHRPANFSRLADDDWTFTYINFINDILSPGSIGVSETNNAGSAVGSIYTVTGVDSETGVESLPGIGKDDPPFSHYFQVVDMTKSNPLKVWVSSQVQNLSHIGINCTFEALNDGPGEIGEELNGRLFKVVGSIDGGGPAGEDGFSVNIDGTKLKGTYTGGAGVPDPQGGSFAFCDVGISTAVKPTEAKPNTISWYGKQGISTYNIYKEQSGVFGLIGVAEGPGTNAAFMTFKDIGQDPDYAENPPSSRDPFLLTDSYPSHVAYIQQRLAFANITENTEKIWLSRTGDFYNYSFRRPLQDDDAITFTLAGRQVNAIQSIFDIGKMVILTSGGEWAATGDEAGIIRPTDINARQYSYYGASPLRPIIIGQSALYLQNRSNIIRDLGYDLQIDGYKGNDITIFSSHLFDDYLINDWAYQQSPNSIVWVLRNDGTFLGCTYIKEQQMLAWHRHDIVDTEIVSLSTIPDDTVKEESLYMITRRTIEGAESLEIEKMNTRKFTEQDEYIFMDAASSYSGKNRAENNLVKLTGGTTWESTEEISLEVDLTLLGTNSFSTEDVGNQYHVFDGSYSSTVIRCDVISYVSSTEVRVKPHKTVPVSLRGTSVNTWTRAVDLLLGANHLNGKEISVIGDGFVVASPNNPSYDKITVTNGRIQLDKFYGEIHVGLPITSDIETLDIDTLEGESLADKRINIQSVDLFVEKTRGLWAGGKPPSDDIVDPLENLTEIKNRSWNTNSFDFPPPLLTSTIDVNIKGEWDSNGRVFLRQIDPLPVSVLSLTPSGYFNKGNRNG